MIELTFFTFILVFARATQQQNVTGGHYIAAAITPYIIATGEVAAVLYIVQSGWQAIPWVGTGGAIGACTAMYLHKRVFKKIKRETA